MESPFSSNISQVEMGCMVLNRQIAAASLGAHTHLTIPAAVTPKDKKLADFPNRMFLHTLG